jgi:hypothetical protein
MSEEIRVQALVGVYADAEAAESVRRALTDAGVRESEVRIGSERDRLASLHAEMQEETEQAYIAPQAGLAFTKEATKSSLLIGPLFVLAGGIIAFPFSFIPIGGLSFWVRCFWIVLCGMTAGGAVAAIAIPALSAKSAFEPSAAQRGVVVRVDAWSPQIEEVMAEGEPIRLDRIGGEDFPLGTVTTEEDRRPGGALEETKANVVRELRAEPEERRR